MKLTDLLIHKKYGQSDNVNLYANCVIFQDINVVLPLNEWHGRPLDEFDEFISKYQFPDHDEFKKKDKQAVRATFPRPQVLLTKVGHRQDIRIALALYPKEILTGKTLLHLRSINKFEQMEIRYFINLISAPINEPKIQKTNFFEFCQSGDILFNYNFLNSANVKSARLRIVTLKFGEFILLLYAFDKDNALSQENLHDLITSFESKTL